MTEALAFINKQQEEPEHFSPGYFSVQSGSSIMATASVKLICGGEEKAEAATGNGPVDAVYQAINRITDYPIELVKYQLTAKGHGRDALGRGYRGLIQRPPLPRRRSGDRHRRILRQGDGARVEQYLALTAGRKRKAAPAAKQTSK